MRTVTLVGGPNDGQQVRVDDPSNFVALASMPMIAPARRLGCQVGGDEPGIVAAAFRSAKHATYVQAASGGGKFVFVGYWPQPKAG